MRNNPIPCRLSTVCVLKHNSRTASTATHPKPEIEETKYYRHATCCTWEFYYLRFCDSFADGRFLLMLLLLLVSQHQVACLFVVAFGEVQGSIASSDLSRRRRRGFRSPYRR